MDGLKDGFVHSKKEIIFIGNPQHLVFTLEQIKLIYFSEKNYLLLAALSFFTFWLLFFSISNKELLF